jgi:CHAD domain-containing protein
MRHDPGVRVGDDPEDLHQARVATRRLRSDLRTFRQLLDAQWAADLTEELQWVGGLLGAVRDADVMAERLNRQVSGLTPVDPRASASLFRRLSDDHAARRAELMNALDSPRYVGLLAALLDAASEPMLSVRAGEPALPTTAALVRGPWRQLEAAVKALGDQPPDEQLHRVRIQAKRARYAADAAAAVWGRPARRLADALSRVQSVLGDLNDAQVAEQWLRQRGRRSAGQAFLAGELTAMQRAAAEKARRLWPDAWRRASSPKLRSWLA